MGVLRGGLVFLLAIVLFLTLFLTNAFLNLTWALEYKTLEPNLKSYASTMIEDMGVKNQLAEGLMGIEYYCMAHNNFVFSEQGFDFEIPCTVVDSGVDSIISYGVDLLITQIYYGEYNCEIWECVKESEIPFVLISEKAKNYWFDKFKLVCLIALGAFVLMFFFSRDKGWAVMLTGIMAMLSAFLFRKLDWFLSLLPNLSAFDIISMFLSRSQSVFVIMMIVGGFLFLIGIVLKFFKVGFSFSKLFKKKEKKENLTKDDIVSAVREGMSKEDEKKIIKEEKKKAKKAKKANKGYVDLAKK